MAILASDLKFLQAERLTDLDDAGGYPSNHPVLDNVDNNVFPDVASGDRIGGRTHLRKIFAAVRNPDTDVYMASRVYIASPPSDPAVTVGLLVTGSASDDRQTALNALYTEAQQNINLNVKLYQNYYEGETIISLYHFTTQIAPFIGQWPQIGDIILLEDAGAGVEQYVKVTSIDYSDVIGTYQSATLSFTPPLRHAFRGDFVGDFEDINNDYVTPTQTYTTRAVPMGHGLYGIAPLAVAAEAGDMEVMLDRIDIPVAPTVLEVVDASLRPSSAPIQASQSIAAVAGRLQSATIDPMADLSTVRVEFISKVHQTRSSISGAATPGLFTVAGTNISVMLPPSESISLAGFGQTRVNGGTDMFSFTIGLFGAGLITGGVSLDFYSASVYGTPTAWHGRFLDDGVGGFSGSLTNGVSLTFTGTINYATGLINLTCSGVFHGVIEVRYPYTRNDQKIIWYSGDPASVATALNLNLHGDIVKDSLQIIANTADDGELLTVLDNGSGVLTGDATGTLHYDSGLLSLAFSESVQTDSILIAYRYTTASAINQVAGGTLDTVRLPASKAFPLVRVGDQVIIHYPDSETLANPVVAETTYTLARDHVDQIWLEAADGTRIPTAHYTVDLVAGSVTMATGLDLSGYQQPLTAWTSIHTEALATTVNAETKTVRLNRALRHDYPAQLAYLSSQVPSGDLFASCSVPFEQQAWTSVWQDTAIGADITAQFNHAAWPILITNDGAITERWRIQFISTTTVNVIGEHVGQIASALSITADIAPVNPYTGQPYFTIQYEGWGAAWVNGNVLRFNTQSADYPLWPIRVVQPSDHVAGVADRFRLAFLGDVDV